MADKDHHQESNDMAGEAVDTPCLCAALRRASRVMTRRYDQYLKPAGLRVTQYSLMAAIARNSGITVSGLSKIMLMDQTTVTRNLQNLLKAGYILTAPHQGDQRTRRIDISEKGRAALDTARPLWRKAQADMTQTLGEPGMALLMTSLQMVIK